MLPVLVPPGGVAEMSGLEGWLVSAPEVPTRDGLGVAESWLDGMAGSAVV